MNTINLKNISIVLAEPQIPENIGAVARAMKNMGIDRLLLVDPRNFDLSRAMIMATGTSCEILEHMEIHDDLVSALGPFQYVVGTTARLGAQRPAQTNPRRLSHDLVAVSRENRIALMFGPEDRGLSNDHLRYCHTIASIPTADFSSLNLAQSVMIFCYELFLSSREPGPETLPRLANKFELEGMYDHLKDVLMKIGFINLQNPEHWMLNIRRFLSRFPLRAREVRVVRGICRQIDWYSGRIEKLQTALDKQEKGDDSMDHKKPLAGKTILIVDDEPDVLETLEELLDECEVVKAASFQQAAEYLNTRHFDIALLDIMGVKGYDLLDLAREKGVIAVMLTAHALSPEDTVKSFKKGAASYVPKDRIVNLTTYLNDILEAEDKGENVRWRWLKRLGKYYNRKFGPDWKKSDEKFWENFIK